MSRISSLFSAEKLFKADIIYKKSFLGIMNSHTYPNAEAYNEEHGGSESVLR